MRTSDVFVLATKHHSVRTIQISKWIFHRKIGVFVAVCAWMGLQPWLAVCLVCLCGLRRSYQSVRPLIASFTRKCWRTEKYYLRFIVYSMILLKWPTSLKLMHLTLGCLSIYVRTCRAQMPFLVHRNKVALPRKIIEQSVWITWTIAKVSIREKFRSC